MEREKLFDSVKVVAVVILLTLVNMLLPIFSMLVLFIWPIPIAYLAIKHGLRHTAITVAVLAVINGLLFSPIMGVITVIGFGLIGFVIGGCLNEDFSPLKTLIASILAVLVSHVLIVYVAHYIMGIDFNYLIQEVAGFISQNQEFSELKDILQNQLQLIRVVFPGLITISAIITGILNYYLSLWYLNRKKFNFDVFLDLKYWHFPRWVITLGIAISLIISQNPVVLNINVVLMFFAFLQGFAVGLYFISRRDSSLLKVVYVVAIMFIPLVPILLFLLGLVDMWFNVRGLTGQQG